MDATAQDPVSTPKSIEVTSAMDANARSPSNV
jgi:hypothetical protein